MSINRAIERNTIELLRCVLILFIVLIHTNLVADLHCENSLYGRIYAYLSEILWLSNSLFFAISGYLFFANTDFTYESYRSKIGRRVNSLIILSVEHPCLVSICGWELFRSLTLEQRDKANRRDGACRCFQHLLFNLRRRTVVKSYRWAIVVPAQSDCSCILHPHLLFRPPQP